MKVRAKKAIFKLEKNQLEVRRCNSGNAKSQDEGSKERRGVERADQCLEMKKVLQVGIEPTTSGS
jgi:hypothetical protein